MWFPYVILLLVLRTSQSQFTRDALAKSIYSNLFDWLVQRLNKKLSSKTGGRKMVVGILDIYGFEIFDVRNQGSLTRSEQFFWAVLYQLVQWEAAATVHRIDTEEWARGVCQRGHCLGTCEVFQQQDYLRYVMTYTALTIRRSHRVCKYIVVWRQFLQQIVWKGFQPFHTICCKNCLHTTFTFSENRNYILDGRMHLDIRVNRHHVPRQNEPVLYAFSILLILSSSFATHAHFVTYATSKDRSIPDTSFKLKVRCSSSVDCSSIMQAMWCTTWMDSWRRRKIHSSWISCSRCKQAKTNYWRNSSILSTLPPKNVQWPQALSSGYVWSDCCWSTRLLCKHWWTRC